MQDWKVAVLIVIIVVFLVLVSLLLFLLYRFGHWRRFVHGRKITTLRYIDDVEENVVRNTLQNGDENNDMYLQLFLHDPRLRPSPHVLYFIDFQGELLSLDFKKKALQQVKTEPDLQRYLFDTFQPTIEEGYRVIPVTPEMLALSYVDGREALVVLDLNRLLDRDAEFGARMVHTAERPLLLSRLVPNGVDGSVYTTLTRFGYAVEEPSPFMRARGNNNYYLNAPPQEQQQRQQIEVHVTAPRSHSMALTPSPSAAVPSPAPPAPTYAPPPSTTYTQPSSSQTVRAAAAAPTSLCTADMPGMAPAPIIHPCDTHHITTNTMVTVTAATYTVLHSNGKRSVLDSTNTAVIESARLRWDRRQSLVVVLVTGSFAGYQCVLDPVTENGNLLSSHGGGGSGALAEPVVCQRADALQYTVERVNSTQWQPVEKAFCLPAGRWCVRARSILFSDDSTKSAAKVFTVSVV